jgi:hypothetical protein
MTIADCRLNCGLPDCGLVLRLPDRGLDWQIGDWIGGLADWRLADYRNRQSSIVNPIPQSNNRQSNRQSAIVSRQSG